MINVCIQGLGFVGAAMAVAVSSARDKRNQPIYSVVGVDLETELGQSRIEAVTLNSELKVTPNLALNR